MRLRIERERNYAYLSLDEKARVANRIFAEGQAISAQTLAFDFDAAGHLVGVEFGNAERQVPAELLDGGGEGIVASFEPTSGYAYIYLAEPGTRVSKSRGFGEKANRAAHGLLLDLDGKGHLLGIELQEAALSPRALIKVSHPPWPLPGRPKD